MTYSYELKKLILKLSAMKMMSNKKLSKCTNISRTSIYYWRNGRYLTITTPKRKSKIIPPIKCYIRSYVLRKINFNRFKLIRLIKKKFNISISKSTLYSIIRKMNLRNKTVYKRNIFTNKKVSKERLLNF